ncbi:ectonucleotide pyrophosphatase/phosphodiesterase [Algoriphagus sp. CAU 1675]|uniref:alkaline phosphatase family protein n=1 Tax=Algoriphagus sp. CAU 1675 TaxID=3032597 RepID=UPI0023DB25D7|nr:ectonucleotide pyrophosphatase/phosphodiesterase [Algoriphagus sp. CAU 1675]MDF2158496.1 ectonucleotide pyrophosphatase/phosphodiesterase [Algoriphagus sp. CAU 1675]
MSRYLFSLFILLLPFASIGQNSNDSAEKETYVILISLDGFRYDYVERFHPENLSRFIQKGTAAEGLIPSFPSKTFPNHYTIATGMLPEHHGLVDNSFYNPQKDQTYAISNREVVTDGSWYGGTPIWVLAEQNGMKAASYFFVGSEADIQGIRPSYYYDYDGTVSNLTRISKVFEWLQLPKPDRPRMITLYFSDMDDVGHGYGPGNEEKLSKTLTQLDHELGALFEGLKSLDLDVNVIIVSDHGMADVPKNQLINLDQLTEGIDARVVNSGALAHVYLKDQNSKEEAIRIIGSSGENFKVVDVQEGEYYRDLSQHADLMGDLLILPDLGYYLADQRGLFRYQNRSAMNKTDVFGEHGYSPDYEEMQGIFYANGPQIKAGLTIPPFKNVHIYTLICEILGLPIPKDIDGKKEVLAPILTKD